MLCQSFKAAGGTVWIQSQRHTYISRYKHPVERRLYLKKNSSSSYFCFCGDWQEPFVMNDCVIETSSNDKKDDRDRDQST